MKARSDQRWRTSGILTVLFLVAFGSGTLSATAASNKNVWIWSPVYTKDAPQDHIACIGTSEDYWADTHHEFVGTAWGWSYPANNMTKIGEGPDWPVTWAEFSYTASGGPFNVTASYKGEASYAARVKILEVLTASATGATEIDDLDGNPNTRTYVVCKGTGNVTVTATCKPTMTEQQLQNTCWGTSGGSGTALLTRTVSKANCTTETITFTAGSSQKTVTVKVLDVQITSPQVLPPSANDFTYDTASAQNTKCIIAVAGSTCDSSEDAKLEWTLSAISGATLTSSPSPAKGANVTFTYTRMPSANSQLGNRTLTLNYPPTGCSKAITLQIFFPKFEKNHPGGLVTPNWHYYWQQAGVSPGGEVPIYWEALNQPGVTLYVNGVWTMYVDDDAAGTFNPVIGPQSTTQFDGIDAFAYTWRHERQHKLALTAWFPQGHNLGIDADNDDIPDAYEATILPVYGGPYSTNNAYTHGYQSIGITDGHEYVYRATQLWSVGTADAQDWAKPGHQ